MDEAECCGPAVVSRFGVGGDRLAGDRPGDGSCPLLPLVGVLWLPVGAEQQAAAERAAPALPLEHPQPGRCERGSPAQPPGCPVTGQGRVLN